MLGLAVNGKNTIYVRLSQVVGWIKLNMQGCQIGQGVLWYQRVLGLCKARTVGYGMSKLYVCGRLCQGVSEFEVCQCMFDYIERQWSYICLISSSCKHDFINGLLRAGVF